MVAVLVHALGLGDTLLRKASVPLFWLDGEQSLPVTFSIALLLCGRDDAADRAWDGRRARAAVRGGCWRVMGVLLALLAFGEAFVVHETFGGVARRTFGLSGVPWHAWVLTYGLMALTVAALIVRPLPALLAPHPGLRGRTCYVVGAAGVELVASRLVLHGASRLARDVSIFVEESMEVGVWLFLAGMLTPLRGSSWSVALR